VLEGALLPQELLREAPGMARNHLYLALWAAPSAERARALLPVAQTLDSLSGGDRLARYVAQVASKDFAVRAPLAAQLAGIFGADLARKHSHVAALRVPPAPPSPSPAQLQTFVETAQRSGNTDLVLGALPLLGQSGVYLKDYEAAARALADPWFLLNVEREKAMAEISRGELARAESRVLAAFSGCGRAEELRCAQLELLLTDLYVMTHRLSEARSHAHLGFERARRQDDMALESNFLRALGNLSRMQNAFALVRAYLGECALQQPEFAPYRGYLYESLASVEIFRLRPARARAQLEQAFALGVPLTWLGAFALADLARLDPRPEDLDRLTKVLDALEPGSRPAQHAFRLHIEGRARLPRDPVQGQRLLRQAISEAQKDLTDPDAAKARAYSYTLLRLNAGKTKAFAEALALFGEETGVPTPARCVLGVEVHDEQSLVVARDAKGEVQGAYEGGRASPALEVESLVPSAMVDSLRACPSVEVLARTGLHGRPGLLPPPIAWSYRTGKAQETRPPSSRRSLVVADVEAPASLGLPRLKAWDAQPFAGRVSLMGAAATPSRVLAAMAEATEVEIHAHGLVNLGVSDASLVVLSSEADGDYALTAGRVRKARLSSAPVVLLAACRAAESVSPSMASPWSLPVAFVEAGARAVIASPQEIPDREAGPFFEAVLARVRDGASPAVAVRDERARLLAQAPQSWVRSVVVFE